MSPFKPKNEVSRRSAILNLFRGACEGETVSYVAIGAALGITDRDKVQAAVNQARSALLKKQMQALINVKNVGYRVAFTNQHMTIAGAHETKATRQIKKALRVYSGTDLEKMTDVERKIHRDHQMLAQALYESHSSLDRRIKRIEDLLEGKNTINQK